VKSILTTLLVVMLVAPATALAHGGTVLVPPGDSASSQYVETVPTDKGGAVPGSGSQPDALSTGQRRRLVALGPDGKTLAAVVQTTSPPPAGAGPIAGTHSRGSHHVGGTAPGASDTGAAGPSESAAPLSAAGAPSTASLMLTAATGGGSGGSGILLPLLLLAAALGVILHAVLRWRARAS
jgi:hypothetical protein